MEIILYTPFDKVKQGQLQKEIYETAKQRPTMVSEFNELFEVLRQRISGHVLITFFISSVQELDFLLKNNEFLFNIRFILILINGDDEMISKGLSLYPRYIAHLGSDFKDIASVVKRIIQKDQP